MKESLRPGTDSPETLHTGTFSKGAEVQRGTDVSSDDASSEYSLKQAGVKRIEAISKSWTTLSLVMAYVS